jgi:hypothetical protein
MKNTPQDTPTQLARIGRELPPVLEHPAIVAGKRQSAVMRHLMSGDATFLALKEAVEKLAAAAPKDHDVVIHAFDIFVVEVRFLQPHTLLLRGFDQNGHQTFVVAHYSQMVAHVVYRPKRGPKRVITGFNVEAGTET